MITQEKFHAWEHVRASGITNMFMAEDVAMLTGGICSKAECIEICKHYSRLKERFGVPERAGMELREQYAAAVNGGYEDDED